MTNYLILMRHGQSEWNQRNLFTGWVDIPLSQIGVQEALNAGKALAEYPIDMIFTSKLIRAQMTAMLALLNHPSGKVPLVNHEGEGKMEEWAKTYGKTDGFIPVQCAWELNERMYGELQGLDKAETAEKYGKDQVKIWRRSFDMPPPNGESLKMTLKRVLPYYENKILPEIKNGKNVLISAHGNSLRAIIMHLENMSKEDILEFEIPTGEPIVFRHTNGVFEKL
ncbi:MAG: 2,3-bisphosphoglycerate-dependent phosphoglycerate mutase [Parachlamydiales bacterium]|nr:2,3-bisphosphoglycerate-dependent phosphoglycerate mutase [Parachlamydiales bacterium]